MITSPSYMTDYKVVQAVAEGCKESGLTSITEFLKTPVDIIQLETSPGKTGFVTEGPLKRCEVTEISIERGAKMEEVDNFKDEDAVLSTDLFDLRERANRLSEGLKKLSVMEESETLAKLDIEAVLPPDIINLVKSVLEEEKQLKQFEEQMTERPAMVINEPINELKINADQLQEKSGRKDIENMIVANVKPTKHAAKLTQSKLSTSSDTSSSDEAIIDGDSSSSCSSSPRPPRQPWLYSYPDFTSRTTGSNSFWQMPFRNKLYQELLENSGERRDSAGILIEEHKESIQKSSNTLNRDDLEADFSQLGSSPWWDPRIFAPTGDIYSYFHRRRLDPASYQTPHIYSTKQSLGGSRQKLYHEV